MKKRPYIILIASTYQILTSSIILFDPHMTPVARLGLFYLLFPNKYIGGILMFLGAILALVAIYRVKESIRKFIFYIPQWSFLILTSASSMNYVILGHYADGVVRPFDFMFQDQSYLFVFIFWYTIAIFDFI